MSADQPIEACFRYCETRPPETPTTVPASRIERPCSRSRPTNRSVSRATSLRSSSECARRCCSETISPVSTPGTTTWSWTTMPMSSSDWPSGRSSRQLDGLSNAGPCLRQRPAPGRDPRGIGDRRPRSCLGVVFVSDGPGPGARGHIRHLLSQPGPKQGSMSRSMDRSVPMGMSPGWKATIVEHPGTRYRRCDPLDATSMPPKRMMRRATSRAVIDQPAKGLDSSCQADMQSNAR